METLQECLWLVTLSSQTDGSLAFLAEIKIAELFIALEARPLGPVGYEFLFEEILYEM